MESGHASTTDELRAFDRDHDLGGPTAPGMVDEIGDRILILDERHTPTLEVLRFRQALTTSPGFEVALRRRVERLRHFRNPAFARAPGVEYLGQDRRLALLSGYTPGRRLSDVLAQAHDPVLAASLIHQLTPALDTLNNYSEGVGHGALTASRIVCAPDGSLILLEHVLGSAVERLHLTAAAIRRDLGIPVPGADTEYPLADGPTDCFQLALIALSMLLGRPLVAHDHADLAGALNAAFTALDRESIEPVSGLRVWLGRALQLERGFLTSGEAKAALRAVSVPDAADAARRWRALREAHEATVEPRPVANDALWVASPAEHTAAEPTLAEYVPAEHTLAEHTRDVPPPADAPLEAIDPQPIEVAEAAQHEPVALPMAVASLAESHEHTYPAPNRHRSTSFQPNRGYLRWALVGVALFAIVEAFVISRLLAGQGNTAPPATVTQINLVTNDPGAPVKVNGQLAGVTPLDLSIDSGVRSISVGSALALTPKQEMVVGSTGLDTTGLDRSAAAGPPPVTVPPPAQRTGGIRVSSPIELEVFEGDRRLGTTATGIVPAAAGRHEVDLINSVFGFRSRQVVDVKAGQVAALTVSPPNGRININAVPWAEVFIAGKSVGETPIGNLSLPLGEHEVVFRHPQLGEARRTAVVRLDAVTRVSANLQR